MKLHASSLHFYFHNVYMLLIDVDGCWLTNSATEGSKSKGSFIYTNTKINSRTSNTNNVFRAFFLLRFFIFPVSLVAFSGMVTKRKGK